MAITNRVLIFSVVITTLVILVGELRRHLDRQLARPQRGDSRAISSNHKSFLDYSQLVSFGCSEGNCSHSLRITEVEKGGQELNDFRDKTFNVSICDLQQWVHGNFKRNEFIPAFITDVASLKPPKQKQPVANQYHWFTRHDAEVCLRNKRIWVIGDSYMRNLFIGLMDVIRGNLGRPNESITQGVPEKRVMIPFLPKRFGDVGQAHLKGPNITATFVGGRRFSLGLYSDAVKVLLQHVKDDDLVVFNALIHDNKRNRVESPQFKGNLKAAETFYLSKVRELSRWIKELDPKGKIVWSTSTSYKENKVPEQFRKYQSNKRILDINKRAAQYWKEAGIPVLDIFHITLACQAETCTADGSHHNRMVNRAKAHVLLNYFCHPNSCVQQ
jgi:lysophospholipase L1-like esterase